VLWANPVKESPKWSEDEGIVVKRKSNPKEATVEAWGLVDGQPTSKHYGMMVYDDVVTRESVTTPDMMEKTTDALRAVVQPRGKGLTSVVSSVRVTITTTPTERSWSGASPFHASIPRPRMGRSMGSRCFSPERSWRQAPNAMGPYVFSCQMLLDPTADDKQGFKEEWIKFAATDTRGHNLAILIDAASSKKKDSDYTAGWVIGLGPDRKVYVHDMIRDRLSLTERAALLMAWHRKYQPMAVGYERYGMMGDVEHIRDLQERENYRFEITEVGGMMSKVDRIRRLIPWFEQGRIYLHPKIAKTDYEGRTIDLTQSFINDEYKAFPVATHDDMLDALARFLDDDLPIRFPLAIIEDDEPEDATGRNVHTGY
jgi:predicted phage terminase large subunit-like protein